jgi:hypothetical protein
VLHGAIALSLSKKHTNVISWWADTYNICDKAGRPKDACFLEHSVKLTTACANKWDSFPFFMFTWSLPYNHDPRRARTGWSCHLAACLP